MRRIFRDERYERLFASDGFVLVKAFDAAAVKRIEDFYLANFDQDFTGFRNPLEAPPEQKAKTHQFLAQIFAEYLSGYFYDYKPLFGGFLSKQSDPGSVVGPHQDWWLVDETEHTSLNLWAPLCGTNAENGALGLVKGSHRLKQDIVGTNLFPALPPAEVCLKYTTFVHTKAGEVLVYSTRSIHASAPNRSGRQRVVASVGAIPSEARPLHYVGGRPGTSKILELEVDEDFYDKYHMNSSRRVSPSDDHIVNAGAYRGREVEHTPFGIDERQLMSLREPEGWAAPGRIKDRLKKIFAFR